MSSNASKRARRNVRRGKAWEATVAEDLGGRSSRGAGSDGVDYYGKRYEAKRRKTAPRWLWRAYYDSHYLNGFFILDQAIFIPYKDGLKYMSGEQWKFPKILLLMPVLRTLPNYLSQMLEQATADVDRERPGDVPRVALHVDQRAVGTQSLEMWIFPFEQFIRYAEDSNAEYAKEE